MLYVAKEALGDAQITLTGAGSGPQHLVQVLLIASKPRVSCRERCGQGTDRNDTTLLHEPAQMREASAGFGQFAGRRPSQPVEIEGNGRFIRVGDRVSLLGQPTTEGLVGVDIFPDGARSIPWLMEGEG
jgi:hypothetical protein